MLNIPASVKALFKTDGTRKNFRAHFPNGEFSDITNENVVKESVKFTESLCSQNTFRYGLAEASVLQFETVGVGNMYGMTIEASIEIDTTSLTAAQISAIQAGTWDGELVLAAASDIGFGFFRVPLGTFRIESCPRNHGAMAHRQVTAYTQLARTISYSKSEFEKSASEMWQTPSSKKYGLYGLLAAKIGSADPQYLAENFTKTLIYSSSNMHSASTTLTGKYANMHGLKMKIDVLNTPNFHPGKNDIYQLNVGNFDYEGAKRFIDSAISNYGEEIDFVMAPTGYALFSEEAAATVFSSNLFPSLAHVYNQKIVFRTDQNAAYLYSTFQNQYTGDPYFEASPVVGFIIHAKIDLYYNGSIIDTFEHTATEMPTIYQYIPHTAFPNVDIVADPVLSQVFLGNNNKPQTVYKFDPLSDIFADVLASALELGAEFAKSQRSDGTYDFIRLNNSSPVSIVPGDYSDCWWDEYDVEPIGTVNVSYSTEEEPDNIAAITIGTGASQYDMTENKVLDLSASSLSSIETIINQLFAPHANTVAFTPAELTMQGWPWLEAGDALEIEAEDSTLVETYALRVEMSGIQHLQSIITATGGEIIEEV